MKKNAALLKGRTVCVLLFLTMLIFIACQESPAQAEEAFKSGLKLYEQGEFKQAIVEFTKAIEIKPDMAKAYQKRADAFFAINSNTEAIEDLNKSIEIIPENISAWLSRANIKAQNDDVEGAIADYEQVIKLKATKKTQAYTNVQLAKLYMRESKFEQAEKAISESITLDDDNEIAYTMRGTVRQMLGKHDEAKEDFNKAIDLKPNRVYTYSARGNAKMAEREYKQAIEDYNRAIELFGADNPDAARVFSVRGQLKLLMNDRDGAIEDLNKSVELDPSIETIGIRGIVYAGLGEDELAKADLEKALSIEPETVHEMIAKAQIMAQINDFEGSVKVLDAAIEKAEDVQEKTNAYLIRNYVKCELEDFDGALADCNKVIELLPNSALGYNARAYVKAIMGDYELAKADAVKTVQLSDGRFGYYNLACFEARLDDTKNAFEHLDKALQNKEVPVDVAMNDPDFETCKDDPDFQKILDKNRE